MCSLMIPAYGYNRQMQKLALAISVVFSLTIYSSASSTEWTKVSEKIEGTYYVDIAGIRKLDGYVYFWEVINFSEPTKYGMMSGKVDIQGDCDLFQYKRLGVSLHKEPMGEGIGKIFPVPDEWKYPTRGSAIEDILKTICIIVQKYREQ